MFQGYSGYANIFLGLGLLHALQHAEGQLNIGGIQLIKNKLSS